MYLTPKKAQPRMIVATSHPVIALRPALVCAARTASAMVRLLAISTMVLKVPQPMLRR